MPTIRGRGSLSLSFTLVCFTLIACLTLLPQAAGSASTLTITLVQPTVDPDLSAVTNGPNPVAVVTGQDTVFEAAAALDGNALGSWDTQYWQWDFGDGTPLDGSNPTQHTYQADGIYNAQVTLNYSVGQQVLLFTVVATTPPPVLSVQIVKPGVDPCYAAVGAWTTFQATAYRDDVAQAPATVGWQWDFGDDTQSTANPADHLYSAAGSYLVTVTATLGDATATASAWVLVSVTPGLTVTIDAPSPSNYPVPPNQAATFHATALMDGVPLDDADVTWNWNFGDQTDPSADNPVSHTFADAGEYIVTVTATVGELSAQATLPAQVAGAATANASDPNQAASDLQSGHTQLFVIPAFVNDGVPSLGYSYGGGPVCDVVEVAVRCATNYSLVGFCCKDPTSSEWLPASSTGYNYAPTGANYAEYRALWYTNLGALNAPVDWEAIISPYGPWGTGIPITATFTPNNTVVTPRSGEVIRFDPDKTEGLSSALIRWGFTHLDLGNMAGQFSVGIEVCDIAGNPVWRQVIPSLNPNASGDVLWSGQRNVGTPAGGTVPKGIYTYRVVACHGALTMDELASPPAIWPCSDWDKRETPGIHIVSDTTHQFTCSIDVPTLTVTATVPWAVNGPVANCAIDIYSPKDLKSRATIKLGSFTGAASDTAHASFTIDKDEVGAFTAVISACQTDADGLSNRDGKARQIAQRGATYELWPQAYDMSGLNGDPTSHNWGTLPFPEAASAVADAVAKQGAGDGTSHYAAALVPASAQLARADIAQCAVFFYCGHSHMNQLNPSGYFLHEVLYGNSTGSEQPTDDPSSMQYYLSNMPPMSLRHCLFACFGGCEAAWDVNQANLLTATIAQGATCAMGFKKIVTPGAAPCFWSAFWRYATHPGLNVWTAGFMALGDLWASAGDYYGYDSFEVRNPVKLMPARFGG